ncbi:MAG: molybdate transport system permease protein [Candidatus Poriferisodalaceae bacterium]|jgi:molybdate transport system permease protein|tara:strand:+ start:4374 stop:5171 length:798 start_codon:yes stop_codon:yes gene_type:complete
MKSPPSVQRLPLVVRLAASTGALFLIIPIVGLVGKASWSSLLLDLKNELVLDALQISITSSIAAALLAVLFGTPLGIAMARITNKWSVVLRSIVLLPMILPPVVGGSALLFALGRNGIFGKPLFQTTGLILPYSWAGVVIANLFVALPFVVLSVESGHRLLDRRYELASASLGAGANRRLTSITLPLLRPSILAGGLLAWGRALGEFGATITFAGNMPGTTQTLPLAVYGALETDRQLALAISLLMVSLSLFIVITMRQHWWSHR